MGRRDLALMSCVGGDLVGCFMFSVNLLLFMSRGVHSGDRVGFGRMLFGSVVFRISYFSDVCYCGSHSGQLG